ncbi:MAG TPA: hypothetical protein VFT90_18920 [Chryseosolibacter sp.]|nr:hypothetical protein [Chryseosolibacter sp.]
MIEKLINLVRQNAGDEIVNNPAIPNEQNDEAMREMGEEINKGLEQEARQGNIQNLVSMFGGNTSGGLSSNPTTRNIISRVAAKFASKFGIPESTAASIAAAVVPKVLNQFINKTNDPNDREFDLQDVLKNFTGNSNVGDLMGQFTGGNKGLGETIGGFFNKK